MNSANPMSTPPNATEKGAGKGMVTFFERLIFRNRPLVLLFFLVVSIFLGYKALSLRPDASFNRMIPTGHEYVQNYLRWEEMLAPQSNVLRVIVENESGYVFNAEYMETLREVTDAIFYLPGVDRGNLKSLWTPNALWTEVTNEGLRGGRIIPDGYDGSEQSLEQVRINSQRANMIGTFVANDMTSTIIRVPLTDVNPDTGEPLDYGQFTQLFEEQIRDRFNDQGVTIRVVGFAQIIGDLIAASADIALFFAVTVVLISVLLLLYCRCWRSTAVTVFTCILTVICQLGLLTYLDFGLDPYSILVPFLIFAIGISHAVQNINLMISEMSKGSTSLEASRATFRALFVPGSSALIADGVGFATLMVIDIGVIQQLAITASLGVFVALFTKMFLLPVLMSYVGVSKAGLAQQKKRNQSSWPTFRRISSLVKPKFAIPTLAIGVVLLGLGYYESRDLKIGDLDPGAPEFHAQARYNQDNAYILDHYTASTDVYQAIFTTPPEQCSQFAAGDLVLQFQEQMREIDGVEAVYSLYDRMKFKIMSVNKGNPKWAELNRNQYIMNDARTGAPAELVDRNCSIAPVTLYLADHKADTLERVTVAVESFARQFNTDDFKILLLAGNAGIQAATNEVIEYSEKLMLILVFAIVGAMVWMEFRSLKIAFALMAPLYLSTVLAEAVMANLGLGVKIATLPVIALGVGIGVDYGIYLYSRMDGFLQQGHRFQQAFFEALKTTGTAVAFTGATLAIGVATWIASTLKFQADMGLLLVLLFVWNMLGAILLMPPLASLLVGRKYGR
ncbi:efflux RND transporter permease subunit [Marinobacter mobilis]|uniref:SSD domain-containing protein n=1 Tax=Marinobacter mobilis TaxID=488533 RepID=A0A1H2XYA7_9GAMM|nr:MMPL family transporter [Marinobacter mobilis]SDW97558.1 hypothetical protein SAMN04487960_105190 [Marinobacter mobilis]